MQQKRPFSSNLLLYIVLLVAVIGAWWLWREPLFRLWRLLQDQTAVSATIRQFGWFGPFILAFAQFLQVLIAIIPGQAMVITGGYVYGFWFGFLLNIVSTVASSQLCFGMARRWGRPFVYRLASAEQVERWQHVGERRGLAFFTVSFMLPLFPNDVMNFVAGLTGISNRHFFAANVLGRLPSTILLTYIGAYGALLTRRGWLTLAIIWVILFLAGRYAVNHFQENEELPTSSPAFTQPDQT